MYCVIDRITESIEVAESGLFHITAAQHVNASVQADIILPQAQFPHAH